VKEVILLVGTRAAGKSTFSEEAVALEPSMVEVSRDKILVELFGSAYLSPYTGGHFYANKKVWEAVETGLQKEDVRMILDAWNGEKSDRMAIIKRLRDFGADRVVAWYFVTPVQTVEEWFWMKPGIAKMSEMHTRRGKNLSFYSEDAPRKDHEMFHHLARNIESDGFDDIVRVNPLTMNPEHVLKLQTSLEF
jgi:predicted kinase